MEATKKNSKPTVQVSSGKTTRVTQKPKGNIVGPIKKQPTTVPTATRRKPSRVRQKPQGAIAEAAKKDAEQTPTASKRKTAEAQKVPKGRGVETTKHDPKVILNMIPSTVTTLLRVNRGVVVKGHRAQPEKLLELYEAEYCPFCRHVREALTELDIDAHIFPMPKGGKRYRQSLVKLGGKPKIPFLHDPNTGVKMYESEAIVEYLYRHYGKVGVEVPLRRLSTSTLATATRGSKGMFAKPSVAARKPLELYSFEGSPYVRLVRELMCELETTYIVRNVGKSPGSYADFFPPILRHLYMKSYMPATVNRKKFLERAGKMMVPYIVDPNTNTSMWQTSDIQDYLRKTYGKQK